METETATEIKKVESKKAEPPKPKVDDHGQEMLAHLGFKEPLPEGLVRTYVAFKKLKDKIRPGRLSEEGFATVVMLYELGA